MIDITPIMPVANIDLDIAGVADASVFPSMIGVNPCLTCMMIGEKCAALLRGTR